MSRARLTAALLALALVLAGCVSPVRAMPAAEPTPTTWAVEITFAPEETPSPEPTPEPSAAEDPEGEPEPTPSPSPTPTYILNKSSKRFHKPTCSSVEEMKPKNRAEFYGTREEAMERGYVPCGRCKP